MLVVERGSVIAMVETRCLELLERIASGESCNALAFGAEIGPLLGEVSDLVRPGGAGCPANWPHDPHADIIVIESGEAYSLRPNAWLAFVVQAASQSNISPADFGPSLGRVLADTALLTPAAAATLALQIRAGVPAFPDRQVRAA